MHSKPLRTLKGEQSQRLDKWLKISRIVKTRSLAAAACQDSRVKINGKVAKASKLIKPGDTLTLRGRGGKYRSLEILAVSHRCISSKDAKMLYREEVLQLSEETQELMDMNWQATKDQRPKYKGRPTKRERRKLERFRTGKRF